MLSRVADNLYWMSRYLERAEHTARLLDLNLHWMLDQKPEAIERRWRRVLKSLNAEWLAGRDPQAIGHALSFDPLTPNSIRSCMAAARRNAREIREQISSEMWERLNRLYLQAYEADENAIRDGHSHSFYSNVKGGAHLLQGIADATMSHDESWHFLQLGRFTERVMAGVNLLRAHFVDEADALTADGAGPDQYLEWVGLLKSCTAFEAYCRVYTADVRPERVVEFLLLNNHFPHAVRYGVGEIRNALEAVADQTETTRRGRAHRMAGRLASSMSYDQMDEILARGLQAYLADIQQKCAQIHNEIYNSFIAYPVESALAA